MPERINVLTVVTTMETGGIELYLLNVLRVIDRTRFNVTIVCAGRDSNWYKDELDELGVQTVFCPNPYTQLGYIRRIGRVMRNLGTHVVCDFRSDFAAPTLWAARRHGIKSRIAVYQSASALFPLTFMRRIYAAGLHWATRRWATRIVGASKSVLDAFYPDRETGEKFAVAYNGVDMTRFAPTTPSPDVRREFAIPDDAIVVGQVGRLHVSKNHPVLLRSFAQLRHQVKDAHLLLVGEGELRPDVEALITDLHLTDHVTLAGRRADIPRMLSAIDIYFFPSLFEGHPNALVPPAPCSRSNHSETRGATCPTFIGARERSLLLPEARYATAPAPHPRQRHPHLPPPPPH